MILVTGATGFVGQALISSVVDNGLTVLAGVRSQSGVLPENVQQYILGELSELSVYKPQMLQKALSGVEVIIHLAARVHVMRDSSADPLSEFMRENSDATLVLAREAAMSGVKRFIYLSSIKVNGEFTDTENGFSPEDINVPSDPYAKSKYEAEQGLLKLAEETAMEVVIIRPPLVYGPGVKANFASMMKWVYKGVPLPFGSVHNKRSLVALDNLVSFIIHCLDHPKAANEIFLISDGEDVSTTELLQKVAKAFGKKALLLPIPVILMKLAAKLLGKGDVADRLFGSLQIDSSKARELLGWKPVTSMDEQLKKTAQAYISKNG